MGHFSESHVPDWDDQAAEKSCHGSSHTTTHNARLARHNACWDRHRAAIIRYYWKENLPLRDVRDIMERDHDFNASLKMYKKKLKDWGIRKNIKADEAFEMAAGHSNKSIDFWPESRSSDYDLRIARHLKRCKHGKSIREQSCTSCRTHRDATLASLGTTPTYSSSALANVEMGLHSARIYFETASPAKLAQWTYTPANITLKNEKFMTLFNQSVESLSREAGTKQAFININRAFDMLHGLMKEDHPAVYHMMVNSMALCKSYPSSELCFKVCRMFAKYCQQLSLVVLGTAHPINPCFTADVGMVEFGEVGDFVLFLRGSTDMCIKYGAVYKPGMEASRCRIVSIER